MPQSYLKRNRAASLPRHMRLGYLAIAGLMEANVHGHQRQRPCPFRPTGAALFNVTT